VAEKSLYKNAVEVLERKFDPLGKCHFEVTAEGKFSHKLERELDDYALFIFKEEKYSPDITGFISKVESYGTTSKKIIVAEVKKRIRLTSIYQTKRYAEILNAEYALLISPEPLSERKRRFIIRRRPAITSYYPSRQIIIAELVWDEVPDLPQFILEIDKEIYTSLPEPFKK